jgi:aspartokinase-like uncharacterized kinase
MTVVKVGGSLYDLPGLGPALREWLDELGDDVLLVPGGGALADTVRDWDRRHGLGDETSHVLAVRAMGLAGEMLTALTGWPCVEVAEILADDSLPRSWAVTSDSIAARVAERRGASKLVLLKSVDIPVGTNWPTAAGNGWVDEYFPRIAARLTCPIEVFNFRRNMGERPM